MTVRSKQIIKAFYGEPANYSYFALSPAKTRDVETADHQATKFQFGGPAAALFW